MASSRSFILEYSSSEEELEAQPSRFNVDDLPKLQIPSPFQSDTSECGSPTSRGSNLVSRPVTPAKPLSLLVALLVASFHSLKSLHKARTGSLALPNQLVERNT